MKRFIKSKINILSVFTLTLITLLITTIYVQFDSKTKELKNDILQNEIKKASEYASNISSMIKSNIKNDDLFLTLKENKNLRTEIEDKLRLFKSSKYLHIFLVKKDKKGKLRYLLDAEKDLQERGFFNQKFDPQSELWYKVFNSSNYEYAIQDNIDDLWITFLYPLVINTHTEAILAFDFSSNEHTFITNMITPVKNIFLILSIVLVGFLLFSYLQLYLNYKIEKKGFYDPLTSSYNRLFLNNLNSEIDLSKYELCMFDIDFFKNVNDTYGHDVGDIVLKSFTMRVLNQIKKQDYLVRYGGEEFLLLLRRENKNVSVASIPERIRKLIESSPIAVGNKVIDITVSVGVNNKPEQSVTLNDAIKIADEMLYKAKNTGRNKVIYTHDS